MATILKTILSESVDGRQILITGASSGELTTLHTAVAGQVNLDEVYLYAYNNSPSDDSELTIYWGGVSQSDEVKANIPFQAGRYLIVDGKLLRNGLDVSAYCSSGSGINVDGYVNRFYY